MTLFSSFRARASPSSSDEKDHDSDASDDGITNNDTTTSSSNSTPAHHSSQRTPLLPTTDDNNTNDSSSSSSSSSSFPLRIKLNDGKSTTDFTIDHILPNVTTVQMLKERILLQYNNSSNSSSSNNNNNNGSTNNSSMNNNSSINNRYLRLIVRGRMMAPDTSSLEKFTIVRNDVIHAVLAKEGVRGGQQARMLRRLNHSHQGGNGSSRAGGIGSGSLGSGSGAGLSSSSGLNASTSTTTTSSSSTSGGGGSRSRPRGLWRRIGIDANGVVIPHNTDNENEDSDDDESSEEDSDFEDAHGEIDLESGNNNRQQQGSSIAQESGTNRGSRRRGRRRRERRGFDRLRSVGMTRDEVTAIRLYFARSVDRYIERRRVMIRASRRLRDSLADIMTAGSANNSSIGSQDNSNTNSRQRVNTGDSSNSLLEDDEPTDSNTANNGNISNDIESGGASNNASEQLREGADGSNANNSNNNNNNNFEGEEILLDRLRMEDEWMSTQGPYSEFRMNLNTSNPLLLAAITGGGAGLNNNSANAPPSFFGGPPDMTMGPAGLFFRSRNAANAGMDGDDDDDDDLGGAFTTNGTFLRNMNDTNRPSFHPYNMGPVPSAGTDKDFVWGFILGFFVGFIMLFWVWMPTVPYKQKIGIISGISFQLGLNLLRKSSEGGGGGHDVGSGGGVGAI